MLFHEPVGNLLFTALVKLLLQQLVCPRVQSPTGGGGIDQPSYAIQIKALLALPEVGELGPTDSEIFRESQEDAAASPTNWRLNVCSFWNSWYVIGIVTIGLQSLGLYVPLSHMVRKGN